MTTITRAFTKLNFKKEQPPAKVIKKNSEFCFFHDLIVCPCPYRYL